MRNFLQVTLVHAAIVAMLLISLLTLGLFWVRPVETGYAWFAAATLCWAAYNAVLLEPRILIPPAGLWTALPPIALGWFSICSALFINRLPGCGGPQPRTERALLAFGVIGTLDRHRASRVDARGFVDPGLRLAAGRGARSTRTSHGDCCSPSAADPTFEVKLWLLAAVLTLVVGVYDYLSDYGFGFRSARFITCRTP